MIVALVGASRLLAAELYMLLLLVVLASKPCDAQCAALHNDYHGGSLFYHGDMS